MNEHDIKSELFEMGRRARKAAAQLRLAPANDKHAALTAAADAIDEQRRTVLEANKADVAAATLNGLSGAMIDRLRLDDARFDAIVASLREVAALPDPVGEVIEMKTRPNGLVIERVRVPIGVLAIIYESRPNVTVDAAALCFKSGNAVILRCGAEALETSKALHGAFVEGIGLRGFSEAATQIVGATNRAAVAAILSGLEGTIDLIVPRGGKSLVERVQREARAPVLGHLEGVCHVYVDRDAQLEKAIAIVVNSKMRRVGVCGAAETLLIDEARFREFWPPIAGALQGAGCAIRGDTAICGLGPEATPATDEDWRAEYLDAVIAVRVVDGARGAVAHVAEYGTGHTDAIVTENAGTAAWFLANVDSAIVMHNASTQFADGGEFGLGAEIGIATGRLHARGPVGVKELTTYKNIVRGDGQIRP